MPTNPVYQSSGILYSDMPKVQPYALNESIKASQSLSSSLDRISDFAFKGAKEQAEKKGLQWGIDNPVSTEQIAEAVKMGINPGTLLPEAGTTFADAARKVLAKTSRADLELKARNEITNIRLLSEIGSDIDMDTADAKLRGIIDGYSKVIGSLDPEEGASARASISSYAVDARKQIGEQLVKLNQIENKMMVDEALSTYFDDSLTKLELMDIKDPVKFSEELTPTRLAIINKARQTGPENYNKVIETIKAQDKEIVNTAIANHIAKQPNFGKAIIDLDNGIAGDYTPFFKKADKNDIIKKATEAASGKFNAIQKQEELQNKVNEDKYNDITYRFYNGKINGEEALKEFAKNGIVISKEERKAIVYGQEENPSNLSNYNAMYNRVQVDMMKLSDIDNAANNKTITFRQANDLKQLYFRRLDDDQLANTIIMNGVGVASKDTLSRQSDKIKMVADAKSDFYKKRENARQNNLPFNVAEEAKKSIADTVETSETDDYKIGKSALQTLSSKYGFAYAEDQYSSATADKDFRNVFKKKNDDLTSVENDLTLLKKSLRSIEKFKKAQKAAAGIRD